MATWSCTTCDTHDLDSATDRCPNCGSAHADMASALPVGSPVGTARFVLQAEKAGADWFCEYCNAGNDGEEHSCSGCGAPKSEAARDDDEPVAQGVAVKAPVSSGPRPKQVSGAEVGKAIGRVGMVFGGLVAAGVLGVCCLFTMAFMAVNRTTERVATVKGFEWSRSVRIKELKPVTHEGWSLPSRARLLSDEQRVRYEKDVFSHTETRTRERRVKVGTGYEMRDEPYEHRVMRKEPVYGTWYTYEVDRWEDAQPAEAAGTDQKPVWPEVKLTEKQQAGLKKETYKITLQFSDTGRTKVYEVDLTQFQSCKDGDEVLVTTNVLDKVKSLTRVGAKAN